MQEEEMYMGIEVIHDLTLLSFFVFHLLELRTVSCFE